jgi:hypothetical protein
MPKRKSNLKQRAARELALRKFPEGRPEVLIDEYADMYLQSTEKGSVQFFDNAFVIDLMAEHIKLKDKLHEVRSQLKDLEKSLKP